MCVFSILHVSKENCDSALEQVSLSISNYFKKHGTLICYIAIERQPVVWSMFVFMPVMLKF